jgi:hypothetical protein
MTKYKLVKDGVSIDFPSMDEVAVFRLVNPEWANIEAVAYTEEPEAVAPVVPEQVTLWQLRAALEIMGLEATVTAVIKGMPEGVESKVAWRAWEYANNIRRSSPTVIALKAILELTDEQVDQIFIQADLIDA